MIAFYFAKQDGASIITSLCQEVEVAEEEGGEKNKRAEMGTRVSHGNGTN